MPSTVTVRQTLDPFVDDVQYIASYEATLTPEGHLDLNAVGVEPGGDFVITTKAGLMWYIPPERNNIFHATFVEDALSYDPILTIVDLKDVYAASARHRQRVDAERQRVDAQRRAEKIEYIKGLFSHVGSRILSAFSPLTASHDDAMHTTHITQDPNGDPSTHDDPHLEQVISATAKSSHITTTSIMVNRRLGDRDGYSES